MYFRSLQISRGLAALAVVLYHMQVHLTDIGGSPTTWFQVFGVPFSRGAWFFFVLSGFLMAQQVAAGAGSGQFLARRLVRIYPSYWLAIGVVILLKVVLFGSVAMPDLGAGMTLLPLGEAGVSQRYALGIEWTLVFEVFFYSVCAAFANRRLRGWFGPFLVLWTAAIIAARPTALMIPSARALPLSPYNLLFTTGALTFYAWRAMAGRPRLTAAIGAGAAVTGFTTCYSRYDMPLVGLAGVGLAGLVLLGLSWDRYRGEASPRGSFLERLGDRSYGLYLVHSQVISIVLVEFHVLHGWQATTMLGLITLAATMVVGWSAGSLDLMIHRHCKHRRAATSASPPAADPAGPRPAIGILRGLHVRVSAADPVEISRR